MPGVLLPSWLSVLPPYLPWSDSTRPIAAISSQSILHDGSAELITCSPRWYAARAAAGMPLVEAVEITFWDAPAGTPAAIEPGWETLAGASSASFGTVVPSGSRSPSCDVAAVATIAPGTARLAVQAPDRSASGTSAVAFCQVLSRFVDMQ